MSSWKIVSTAGVEKDFQTDLGFYISASPGTGYVDPVLLSTDYGYGDGSHYDGTVIPARNFSLVGMLIGDSVIDFHAKRKALGALVRRDRVPGDLPVKIRYSLNGKKLEIEARFAGGMGGDGERKVAIEKIGLRFRADDPFWYSTTQTVVSLNIGTTIPGAASTVVTNVGDALCYPSIVITGPGTILQIKNMATGYTLALNTALVAGEVVTFDLKLKTVTSNINGDMIAHLPIPGDIGVWHLIPGANTIKTAISGGATSAQAQFYSAYESVDGVG